MVGCILQTYKSIWGTEHMGDEYISPIPLHCPMQCISWYEDQYATTICTVYILAVMIHIISVCIQYTCTPQSTQCYKHCSNHIHMQWSEWWNASHHTLSHTEYTLCWSIYTQYLYPLHRDIHPYEDIRDSRIPIPCHDVILMRRYLVIPSEYMDTPIIAYIQCIHMLVME